MCVYVYYIPGMPKTREDTPMKTETAVTPQQTPTPLEIVESIAPNGRTIVSLFIREGVGLPEDSHVATMSRTGDLSVKRARAAFIVRAVNAYEPMLEALIYLTKLLPSGTPE